MMIGHTVNELSMLESNKSMSRNAASGKKIGQLLIERGAISGEQLLRAMESQRSVGGRIGTCLLEMEVLSEDILLQTLSEQLSVPALPSVYLESIEPETLQLVSPQVAKRCQAIPFAVEEGDVQMAILDVRDLATLDELAFCTSKRVHPHIANEARIFQALEKHYGHACPSRYAHLLDRLDGQNYRWREGALVSEGPQALSTSWHEGTGTSPSDAAAVGSPEPGALQREAAATDSPESQPESRPRLAYEPLIGRQPRDDEGAVASSGRVRKFAAAAESAKTAAPESAKTAKVPTMAVLEPSQAPIVETMSIAETMASARRPPSPFDDIERLLERQSDREVIGQILLRTLSVAFKRCALFKVHRGVLRGWLSRGQGFDPKLFAGLELSLEDSSIFRHLQQGSEIYIGPLPHSPAHRRMACTWGGDLPKDCLMMPIRVRDHMVCVVYVDNGTAGLQQPDVDGLRTLVHRASLAFEWCILRKKSQQQDERGR